MRTILINFLISGLLLLGGCSIYKVDVQQGNVLDPERLAELKLGMNKNRVTLLIGTPLLIDPFHPNRWDYVHAVKPGDGKLTSRVLTLYFENEKLVKIDDSRYKTEKQTN
ncbi:MAG: outer membrane protein assembly factor BamE [Thioalkalispiraceae bacterium]|jgi:outer membrane protein assembly factor BamE